MFYESYSHEFIYNVIMAYKDENDTRRKLCLKYKSIIRPFMRWIEKFEKERVNGLENSK
ncbi:MAG: hypothetical protein ACFWT6_14390 [Virgibacillus proomii]|jgi:hypothetical protein